MIEMFTPEWWLELGKLTGIVVTFLFVAVTLLPIIFRREKYNSEEAYHKRIKERLEFENRSVITTLEDGTIQYHKKGKLHHEDVPALIYPDGSELWFFEGQLHRKNGPAVVYKGHSMTLIHTPVDWDKLFNCKGFDLLGLGEVELWCCQGKLHRDDDKPAVIYANGRKEWWVDGKGHREKGPSTELPNGSQVWRINGMVHRKNGPAIIMYDRYDITETWCQDGRLTRFDGPAYIKKWIWKSDLHQTMEEKWYKDGKLHRFDGPAVTHLIDEIAEYWLEGVQYSKAEHAHRTR